MRGSLKSLNKYPNKKTVTHAQTKTEKLNFNVEKNDKKKENMQLFTVMYTVSATFEALHMGCRFSSKQ